MTRDEAIEIEATFVQRESKTLGTDDRVCADTVHELAAIGVDRLVAHGLLKLDEPKEPIVLCAEDPDWNWWLLQPKEFKAQTVKELRARSDEPKSANQKFCDVAIRYADPDRWIEFLAEINRAGLRIVEK